MKTKINCLCCVLIILQVVVSLTFGREGQRRRKQGRSARFRHQCRHVKPRAARNGGALEHAPPAASVPARISAVPKALPLQFLEFWGLFCKVWIIWCNFYLFLNIIICIVDVKKREKKKKKKGKKRKNKNIVKKYMCVFECFFYGYIF